nr:hypothetical protein [Tanacetum cinerariifolium]
DPRSFKSIFVGYPKEMMEYSFYSLSENKVFIAWNAEFFESKLLDLKASGSVEDLELIQEEDINPSVDTSLDHEEDDQEINEPQSDINPIRDLGEPANYKAALLDPESKKWLDAMNVEMQSMKDNDVWVLVDLPPNARTVRSKVDYEETFSPVADISAIRILIAIAAYYDYEIWQIDVETAFLNGHLSEEVYMEQPSSNPGEKHWTAVKNILKYLRNTKNMFVVYGGNMERDLRVSCYTDVGYLTDADNLKSQTGYVFVLNGGAVDWKSTKQSIFATSSTDAEYIAAFDTSKEAVWIHKFIFGLGIVPTIEEPISDVKIEKIHTDDNLADPFTKALAFPNHSELTRNIGLFPASSFM